MEKSFFGGLYFLISGKINTVSLFIPSGLILKVKSSVLSPTDINSVIIFSKDFLNLFVYSEIKLSSLFFNDKYAFAKQEKYFEINFISSKFFVFFAL